MSRITGVTVALVTTAAVMTGSSGSAAPPGGASLPPAAELPREVPRGVEVTLADGDLLRVFVARDQRVVWSRRMDAATGTWGARTEVLRKPDLYCGDVDVRTASGAVAVTAECELGGWAEDQAPTASHAVWSPDTLTWSSYQLEGEAYDEPGISPDGSRAVWPEGGGYLTRGPEGFTRHTLDTPGREYTATATITDDARVSYLYGAHVAARRCGVLVLTRTGDAPPVREELAVEDACHDTGMANVDADTVWFGEFSNPGWITVVSRPQAGAPWAVSAIAPATAPGLEQVGGKLPTRFVTATGRPLYAVGSRRGRFVRVQAYDAERQAWHRPTRVYDAGRRRCSWGNLPSSRTADVVIAPLTCSGRHVVLTAPRGGGWRALASGPRPYGLSPDGRLVAVPGGRRTHVISAERGVVSLRLPVTGRCDVVVPDGPDGAVLLSARKGGRGWPTVLRHSSPQGWRTLSRTNLPVRRPACTGARLSAYDPPYRFDLHSRWQGHTVRLVERDGTWVALRSRF